MMTPRIAMLVFGIILVGYGSVYFFTGNTKPDGETYMIVGMVAGVVSAFMK